MTAQAIRLTIGGREVRIRDTFDLALRLEERFGSLFDLILRPRAKVPLADVLGILEEATAPLGVTRDEVKAHISAIGIGGAWKQISQVMEVIAEGWSALNEEATAVADANPPKTARSRKRRASPGATSSAQPASSASGFPNSGNARPSNSPPSGELMPDAAGLLDAMAPNGAAK